MRPFNDCKFIAFEVYFDESFNKSQVASNMSRKNFPV